MPSSVLAATAEGARVLDRQARNLLGPPLGQLAGWLASRGVRPMQLTLGGLVIGLGAVVAAGRALWWLALGLWLLNRLVDGLDGPVARASGRTSELGGFADLVADFLMYGAFVVGCAVGQPDARVAALVLLVTYYVNGAAFLALDGIAARLDIDLDVDDGRTFAFIRSLTEGFETVVAHSLFVLLPGVMPVLMWVFAAMVAVSASQRVLLARRVLSAPR